MGGHYRTLLPWGSLLRPDRWQLVGCPGPRCTGSPRHWPLVLVLIYSFFEVLGTFHTLGRGTPPAKAIGVVFQQYRERALAGDAEGVWSVLDSRTKGFYSEVVDNARALPASGLARLDCAQRLMVLLLRLELRKQELEGLDAQAAFLLAKKREWLHAQGADGAKDLDKIRVIGPHAYAYVPGHPDTLAARFVLEGTEWKLDFGEDVPLVTEQLAKAKTKSRLSEREFFKAMLKRYSDATVDDRVFQGPIE
jgi:hypothetical protein